jgi:hypothetical protein
MSQKRAFVFYWKHLNAAGIRCKLQTATLVRNHDAVCQRVGLHSKRFKTVFAEALRENFHRVPFRLLGDDKQYYINALLR